MNRQRHEDDINQLTPDDFRAYCKSAPDYVNERDDCGYTPLVAACERGNAAIARVLIEAGADPNFIASDGESPLKAAIPGAGKPFNRELFDLLFAAGANPNLGLEPPLHIAVGRGHRELVGYLIAHGADPNHEDADGCAAIFWAGAYGNRYPDINMMRLLIKLGADLKRRDGIGRTVEQWIGRDAMREAIRPEQ